MHPVHKLYPGFKKIILSTSDCLHYSIYYFLPPLHDAIVTHKVDNLSLYASFCIKTQLKIFCHIQDNPKVLQRIKLSHSLVLLHTFPISI